MGSYLNPGSERFRTSLRSQIYVDKSPLIAEINKLVRTEQKYVCVSRPRRFGKSMAADMLLAYYSVGEDTSALFDALKISKSASYREHLNQYDMIKINMQTFLSAAVSVEAMLERLQKYVALAYMTGILPIKKYGSHSALNMFSEYSMTEPVNLAAFFGFTEEEVQALCREYCMSFEEALAGDVQNELDGGD